jgi:hypothetical protein
MDGLLGVLVLPPLVFGVVGAAVTTIWRFRWRFALPLTYAAFVVFVIWFNWYLANDPNLTGRYRGPNPGETVVDMVMMSIVGLLPLVVAFLLAAVVGKRMARPPRPPLRNEGPAQ